MMAAVETPCVWIITDRSIFGISVDKLMQMGKDGNKIDWNSLPSLVSCSDFFRDDLPDFALLPLLYGSNIFLASYAGDVYQLEFSQKDDDQDDTNKKQLLRVSTAPPESIPSLPIKEFCCPFFVNIGGKVYFLSYDVYKMTDYPVPEGFWVLDPANGEWRPLDFPISIGDIDFHGQPSFFVLRDKLYFEPRYIPERRSYLYCFDCETEKWELVDNCKKERITSATPLALPCSPDRTVGLTWRFVLDSPSQQHTVKVCAVLLDSKDNSFLCLQQLDELYVGIESPFLVAYRTVVKFVDLGNGRACALLAGNRDFCERTLLWVIVFSLSWSAQVDFDLDAAAAAPYGEEKRGKFLDVELHVNRLYYLPFVYDPFPGRDRLHHVCFTNYPSHDEGTTSPPRKQLKLDSERHNIPSKETIDDCKLWNR